jgi:hypothetical protein
MASSSLNGLLFAASDSLADDTYNLDGLHACAAGAKNNADILSQSQMLKADDKDDFVSAQAGEIDGLHDAKVFGYHLRSEFPAEAKVLNSIWSYRRKRRPDGTLLKHKTRLCADGSM